jgi:hypothetical protein
MSSIAHPNRNDISYKAVVPLWSMRKETRRPDPEQDDSKSAGSRDRAYRSRDHEIGDRLVRQSHPRRLRHRGTLAIQPCSIPL